LMELNDRFKKTLELYFKIKLTPDGEK
jgi:hypothetical protein